MMWVVRLGTLIIRHAPTSKDNHCGQEHGLYLPREGDVEAFKIKKPVLIPFAARFKTKRQAQLALLKAMSRDFPIDVHSMVYEKYYRRSSPSKE